MELSAGALVGATIAFDLDGALVDTAPDLIGALNTVLEEEGLPPLPFAAARVLVGRGAKALIERGFAAAGAPFDADRAPLLVERFIAIYLGCIAHQSVPFNGVEAALDQLAHAGATLCVCTNKRTDLAVALLDALDLSRRFAVILGADKAPAAKPDPRHLLAAIMEAGGDPTRAIMIGDSITDVTAAKAAYIPVIAVSFGYTDIPPLELGADLVIDHYDQLPAAVARLLACPATSGKL